MADHSISPYDNRIQRGEDLRKLVRGLWDERQLVLIAVITGAFVGMIYLHVSPRIYTVNLEVTPVQQTSQVSATLGALSSLAGASSPNQANTFSLYQEALQSPMAAQDLTQRNDILQLMFPGQWSETDHAWHESGGVLHFTKKIVYTVLGIPVEPWHPPNAAAVRDFLTGNVRIIQPRLSPTIILALDSTTPESAKKILMTLHQVVDEQLRQRALTRASNNVDYALSELSKTSVVEYHQALLDLLTQTERQKMAAASGLSYAAEPLGAPVTSSAPTSPRGLMVFSFFTVLGGVTGMLAAFIRLYFFGVATPVDFGNPEAGV